jgi:hypothetical protein
MEELFNPNSLLLTNPKPTITTIVRKVARFVRKSTRSIVDVEIKEIESV